MRIFINILVILYLSGCSYTPPKISSPEEIKKEEWFTINTDDNYSPSVLDVNSWLDAPAGKYGWVKQVNDHFEFENGQRIKFWGTNIADHRVYVSHKQAEEFARYLQKYGVNAVRFHKHTWSLTQSMPNSTMTDSVKFDKKDYLISKLKENGIYYGWSHIYGHRVLAGDSSQLLAYEEIKNIGSGHLKGSTYNLVYFAPDLQDLSIGLTVNMLNHYNPYTKLRYADDPAFCFLEFNNEDNLFFASAHGRIMQAPTYKRLIEKQFSEWLRKKYGSHQGLIKAWGEKSINAFPEAQLNEHLDKKNIYPMAHHGYLSTDFISGNPHLKKRIWDTARFLYETQNNYYEKFLKAVRATGYKGPIVPSGWQAGDNIAHLYNLNSDFKYGFIDRHNYYGGSEAGTIAMIDEPGVGLLSAGMQQVKNRPFALSEWISVMPNEWITEDAPLIAVYGMGLQGWDASYSYASNQPSITNSLHSPSHGAYNADAPTHMGLYPVLSRMIYRGDVDEGAIVATRHVHVPSLAEGKIGFEEKITQIYDVKEFSGTIPRESLAIGRTVIKFSDDFKETLTPDFSDHWNKDEKIINSITGQLTWHYEDRGFVTINTPGTVGFMGFPPDSTFQVGSHYFRTSNKFAIVLFTALEKDKTLQTSDSILVSTFARAENSGMVHNENYTQYLERGDSPVLMEPVNFSLAFAGLSEFKYNVLDEQGRVNGNNLTIENEVVSFNGSKNKTMYYLLLKDK